MKNIAKSFAKLIEANSAAYADFVQTLDTFRNHDSPPQNYAEQMRTTFVAMAGSSLYVEVLRRFTENNVTFLRECSETVMSNATEQVNAVTTQLSESSAHLAGVAPIQKVETAAAPSQRA